MIYAENIFVALAIPLIIAVFLLKGDVRRFTGFFIIGLFACLLASHINGFLADRSGMTVWKSPFSLRQSARNY